MSDNNVRTCALLYRPAPVRIAYHHRLRHGSSSPTKAAPPPTTSLAEPMASGPVCIQCVSSVYPVSGDRPAGAGAAETSRNIHRTSCSWTVPTKAARHPSVCARLHCVSGGRVVRRGQQTPCDVFVCTHTVKLGYFCQPGGGC